jgi:D-glycero-D-manno-heptose 1,7-bisphosphate phosphatase
MQKALFLDRDGIINVDYGYVYKIQKFQFTQDIFELLHLFKKQNYLFFIVTNQSGIGRGYYTIEEFNTLTLWMLKELKSKNIEIERVEFCPHAPEANCQCRKPKTGMVESILNNYSIDLANSWLIGDKQSDIDLAHNSNIAYSIAIGEREIINSKYNFKNISKCREFFETFSWSNLTS